MKPEYTYLKLDNEVNYPTCFYFEDLIKYAKVAAEKLGELYENKKVCFLVRGTSGVALGTMLGTLLFDKFEEIVIVQSRKQGGDSHSFSLQGISLILDRPYTWKVIVVDDFIHSGETIKCLIEEVDRHCEMANTQPLSLEALVVGNQWYRESKIKANQTLKQFQRYKETQLPFLIRFKHIICS